MKNYDEAQTTLSSVEKRLQDRDAGGAGKADGTLAASARNPLTPRRRGGSAQPAFHTDSQTAVRRLLPARRSDRVRNCWSL